MNALCSGVVLEEGSGLARYASGRSIGLQLRSIVQAPSVILSFESQSFKDRKMYSIVLLVTELHQVCNALLINFCLLGARVSKDSRQHRFGSLHLIVKPTDESAHSCLVKRGRRKSEGKVEWPM